MMLRLLCLAALAVLGAEARRSGVASATARARQQQEQASAAAAAASEEGNPVKRVVFLLQKMKADLEAEAKKELEQYEKMQCWCETAEIVREKAVDGDDTRIGELGSEVDGRSARYGKLATSIVGLQEQIADDEAALDKATAIRVLERKAFTTAEEDLVQTVTNLKNAILVLSRHHSFLQLDAPVLSGLRVLLRDAALRYELLSAGRAEGALERPEPASVAGLLQTAAKGQEKLSAQERAVGHMLLGALDAEGPRVSDVLSLAQAQRLVAKLVQGKSLLQEEQPRDAAYKSYNAQSGEIYGIMKQMLEEFEAELSTEQKAEVKAVADYEALRDTKQDQIATAQRRLDELQTDSAGNQKALSDAKEDLGIVKGQRVADVDSLRQAHLYCVDLKVEWERRSATREAELKAVIEALAIITEDDNREHLAKSFSLLQLASGTTAARSRAAELLRAAQPSLEAGDLLAAWRQRSSSSGDSALAPSRVRLAALAMETKAGPLEKVLTMMDEMIKELKAQQAEEVDFKAYCTKELHINEKTQLEKTQLKEELEAKIESLAALAKRLQKEADEAKAEVAATEVEIKKGSERREEENKLFQETVAEQRTTQAILSKALARLEDYYKKGIGKKVIYMQDGQPRVVRRTTIVTRTIEPPPVEFTKYKDHAGGNPVISMMEQIVEDSVNLEKEATEGEQKAQADYETFVKESNAVISELNTAISTKTKSVAEAKMEMTETDTDHSSTVSELESLGEYEADLHGQCDFVLKNFDIRQEARLKEIEAIQAAKGILSGSKEGR